ncbi:MAG TPA: hypothetical protein DCW90_14960 [Lachnospiraceae bacterium]|nr:hypothetical protein [uncultured Lachnoclostridium sp.]HAU86735.1 hypothetical protein [Lachnospiraceae bacterium]
MIIAFVGIDGSGKTTLLSEFAKYVVSTGKKVQIIKALNQKTQFMKNYNSVRKKFFEQHEDKKHELNVIGSYIMSFDLLQQSELIKQQDSSDTVTILDRWAICQQLYAKVWMATNDFTNIVYDMCLEPDITFVINADLNVIEQRIEQRGGANEFENMMSLRRLRKLYLKYADGHDKAVLVENNGEFNEALQKIIQEYENWNQVNATTEIL